MAWISINFESKALGMPVMTNVLMPQGRGGYKTLYLLHGAGGDYASWLLKSRVADYAEGKNIAVVMPSGNNKCYVNNRYGKDYFTFLTEELIEKCETWFDLSPKKEDRFIAGMSMGGYGAYKWGLTCPEKFAAIGGVAGSYHAEYRYQGKVNTVSTLCEALYGDPPAITPEVHDVFTLLKNRKEEGRDIPRLYTCCGTEDRRHQDSVDLKEFADQLGVPLLFEEGPGRHDDIFFDEYIQKILDWMNFAGKSVEE